MTCPNGCIGVDNLRLRVFTIRSNDSRKKILGIPDSELNFRIATLQNSWTVIFGWTWYKENGFTILFL